MVSRVETVEIPEELYLEILGIVSKNREYNTVTDFVINTLKREVDKLLSEKEE